MSRNIRRFRESSQKVAAETLASRLAIAASIASMAEPGSRLVSSVTDHTKM